MLINEGTKLNVRLYAAAGIIMFSLCAFLIFFYARMNNVKPASVDSDQYSCGYVPYLDSFLYIDMNGKVLSVTKNADSSMPVIEGLKFDQFIIGGYLNTEDNDAFKAIARLSSLFKKYGLESMPVEKIDITNLNDIHLYTKNVYVTFGSIQDADEKIRTLKAVIPNLPVSDGVKGLLDISVIGREYIFTVLT